MKVTDKELKKLKAGFPPVIVNQDWDYETAFISIASELLELRAEMLPLKAELSKLKGERRISVKDGKPEANDDRE